MSDVVTIRGLSKTFAGQQALRGVDLDLRAGEIHALCGANGSGKSTLIKVLSGFHAADPGSSITVEGVDWSAMTSEERGRMHFIHQDLGLIDLLSAAENLELGPSSRGTGMRPLGRAASEARARTQLGRLGVRIDVGAPVGTLAAVDRTMIAIARAIRSGAAGTALLVLDEPTVSLSAREVAQLFRVARALRDDGAAVLYVSHRLEEVFELADRVTVLRDGQVALSEAVPALTRGRLVAAIVGEESEERASVTGGTRVSAARDGERAALSLRNVRFETVAGLDLDVMPGEIVGLTGLVGSGMEFVCDIVFGATRADAGTITVHGRTITRPGPATAGEHGMAFVPADRLRRGCIPAYSIRENLTLASLRSLHGRTNRVRTGQERSSVARWSERVGLQRGSMDRLLAKLSGGNQQKVVLARAMRTEPSVLLLHEPTQGVDVGARAGIHRILREAATAGLAVLAVSADTEDLATFADRVLVMHHGRVTDELSGPELSSKRLAAAVLSSLEPERRSPVAGQIVSQPNDDPDAQTPSSHP